MKYHYLFSQKINLFFILVLGLITNSAFAQGPSGLTWDKEVACQEIKRVGFSLEEDATCVKVCEYSTVNYTLLGDSSTWLSAQWSAAGGGVSNQTLTGCTVDWNEAGYGSLSVTVTTAGETYTQQICLQKIALPEAAFTIPPNAFGLQDIEVCRGEIVYFDNLSNTNQGADLFSYVWDFGDGSTSAAFEPNHTFDQSGTSYV